MNHRSKSIPVLPEQDSEEQLTPEELALDLDDEGLVPAMGIEADEDHDRVAYMPD